MKADQVVRVVFLGILLWISFGYSANALEEAEHVLEKRARPGHKPKFISKGPKTTSLEVPSPWLRTVSGTKKELVTPVVIDGITFSASPKTGKTPEPWISLKKDGTPKTISPKLKNGGTQNPSPDYGTWFDTPITSVYNLTGELEGEEEEKLHEEVRMDPEDRTYTGLNPMIRCTPDRYVSRDREKRKGGPFCTPEEHSQILLGHTYWVTWYTRFFEADEKVRLHLAYVDYNPNLKKRSDSSLAKRDAKDSLFTSDWFANDNGIYPLKIEEEWLSDEYEQTVMLSIQPESTLDDEFNLLNGTLIRIRQGPTVIKKPKNVLKMEDDSDHGWMIAVLSTPTVMFFIFLGYLLFVYITRNNRSFKHLRPRRRRRGDSHKYSGLPTNNYELNERLE